MTTWHASGAALQGWVDGTCGPVVGASVEQHVVHCAQCRAEVAGLVPAESLASGWEAVLAIVEMPDHVAAAALSERLSCDRR